MKKHIDNYPAEIKDGGLGKELHIRFPDAQEKVIIALDAFRETGGTGPRLQVLVYEAGVNDPAVTVRFYDNGRIAETVVAHIATVIPEGAASAWLENRDQSG